MNVSIPSPPRSAPIASTFFDWLSTRWRHRLAHKIGASNSCLSSDQLAALSAELDDALRVRLSRSRLNQALTQRFEDLHTQMVANGMCNPYTRGSLLPPTSLTLNWVFRPDYLASRIADVVSNKRDTATTSIVGGRGVRPILPQAFRYSEKSNKL
jgi:HPt (histidine-containing phosphotransfer) domain-containing protein